MQAILYLIKRNNGTPRSGDINFEYPVADLAKKLESYSQIEPKIREVLSRVRDLTQNELNHN